MKVLDPIRAAAESAADTVDRFGPPEFREEFVRLLLLAWGATDEEAEVVARVAAALATPDYFDLRVDAIHTDQWNWVGR